MKELRVTGLAQETDFEGEDGEVQYLLVLNKGQLRIPIDSDAAQSVLRFLYANGEAPAEKSRSNDGVESVGFVETEDDETGGTNTTDEDGVDQI